jgi:hypothetical protein
MIEIWKNVVVEGKEHPWYSVSNFGNIVSHLRPGTGKYDPNYIRVMKPVSRGGKDGRRHLRVKLFFPENFFEDYSYSKFSKTSSTVSRKRDVHQLVMEAFHPMDEYPPDKLKECWNIIPKAAKKWIKESVTINHKDHNPTNNFVNNLEYTTPKGNSHAAVNYYGGNFSNKGKKQLKIIKPFFNPLFQEWEYITV